MSLESQTMSILNLLLKNPVVLDVETTTSNKGNAFDETNQLVSVQVKVGAAKTLVFFKEDFHKVVPILREASCIVACNTKFDMHWVRKVLGFTPKVVWCCQLAEFLLSRQKLAYPSLNGALEKYGFKPKLDVVKTEYWDKGIDTTEIPRDILAEYGAYDCDGTWEVFLKQVDLFKGEYQKQLKLFRLQCNDLVVLEEMEYNGIFYDSHGSLLESTKLLAQINHIESKIYGFHNHSWFNLNSRDHVSVLIYGGSITVDTRLPIGVYKSGARVGQPRYKIIETTYDFPRLVEPLKGSELQKEGYYSTDEDTLVSLKASKDVKTLIGWLLERSKLSKLNSTYLQGLPKVIDKHNWAGGLLHSNLNQCVATTGRLSSTKPNQQNLSKEVKKFCVTRY